MDFADRNAKITSKNNKANAIWGNILLVIRICNDLSAYFVLAAMLCCLHVNPHLMPTWTLGAKGTIVSIFQPRTLMSGNVKWLTQGLAAEVVRTCTLAHCAIRVLKLYTKSTHTVARQEAVSALIYLEHGWEARNKLQVTLRLPPTQYPKAGTCL